MNHRLYQDNGVLRTARILDCAISVRTTALDSVGINARRIFGRELAQSALFAAIEVDVLDVECVDVTWDVTEYGETDIDKEICTTARDHEDADRREENGDEDDEEGGRCVRHCALVGYGGLSRTAIL
jgi:hypothetical protein